jgi:hypothetical protein
VNGRLFEISKSEERRDEIIKILSDIYTEAEIVYQNTKGGRRIIAKKGR